MTAARRYTVARARAFAARLIDRASWYSGGAAQRARIAARQAVASAGLPVGKEYLELQCARGNEASGLFSEYCAVLGCLDHYEQHRRLYSGLCVAFGEHGLYYDPSAGPNWWNYYFDAIALGDASAPRRVVPLWQHDYFAETIEQTMSRTRAAELIDRYIHVRQEVRGQADGFWRQYAGDQRVIGVHYRGTDKYEEAARVPYSEVAESVRQHLDDRTMIFVATDEQGCLDHFRAEFPARVICRSIRRSSDGAPLHKTPGHGVAGGVDALADCLILARCAGIVRTPSNLGLVASFMNPGVPVTLVEHRRA